MSAMPTPLRYRIAEVVIALAATAYVMHAVVHRIEERRTHRTEHAAHSEEHRR